MKQAHRWSAVPLLCLAALAPVRAGDDALPIIEKAFEAARANEALVREYVFHERIEERRLNRKGDEIKRQSETYDVTLFEGSDYQRLIARNDRPLDPDAEAKEQRKLDKHIQKLVNETPRQRRQRLARVEKEHRQGEEFLEEITRAFDFRVIREEEVDGMETWVISADPKPGYRPTGRMARVLPNVRATLWVAREGYAWVQAEIETFSDMTWAMVYRLRKGTQIRFKQRLVDDEVWVTERWDVRLRANIALVYRLHAELTGTYSNFRRFSTDTTATDWTRAD